ncbi:MAG: cyclase family protein [Chloroflexi bacterium]|nr:cyclase family protein [Chloroflexota bacterium]
MGMRLAGRQGPAPDDVSTQPVTRTLTGHSRGGRAGRGDLARAVPLPCAPGADSLLARIETLAVTGGAVAEPLTKADVDRMAKELSNWGRWGPEDERGTLNLITDEARAAALRLIRDSAVVSCALPLPVTPAPGNFRPVEHHVLRAGDAASREGLSFSADYFAIAPHGMATTHLDALCHVFSNGRMYNGFDQAEVRSDGARRNSIMAGKDGIVGRGVLLDLPGLQGVDWLEPGAPIHLEDLLAAEERQGVRVQPGDIVLIGTGRDARRAAHGPWDFRDAGLAGLYADCLPWLFDRGVAVLGCDGVSDVLPSRVEGSVQPIHEVAIAHIGIHIIDNMALDRLTAACRERNRYAFAFFLAPLRLERGTASPLNPLAVF